MSRRIVVFTGDLSYSVRSAIVEIDRAVPESEWLVVLHAPRRSLARLWRNQVRNVRRNGWRWLPYQLGDIVSRARAPRSGDARACDPGHEYTQQALGTRRNLRVLRVDDIHDIGTIDEVRAFRPDLGLSLAAPILKEALFALPRLGTLNLHKGKVPDYRGMPPAFWELWNDERRVGCTVHRVEAKLDAGPIVAEGAIERERHSSLRGMQLRLDELGNQLMLTAVTRTLQGDGAGTPQPPGGRTFRKPTLAQVAELDRRLAGMEPATGAFPGRLVKEIAYAMAFPSWHWAFRFALRPRVTVLLYHRVSDDVRDNLTVGVAQFDRQMALLRRHCKVLSLDETLALETVPASDRPLVCVTFDDGYLDNFTHAFPILLRHGIAAAFFVSTGMIGTERPFPHDVRRGDARPPTMTWDQVRRMHDRGFTIGSHSVTHIDCVKEPETTVADELDRSLHDLRQRLGLADVYFAYPYGGREHMNRQRLELVRRAGYSACLSAFGGSNVAHVDRFGVLRGGIHWGFSDRAFLFRCLGLR
jgi:peptidoglycan/xylan/chitin deacetylase (PgdA/CDA1 family)